jgi:hypothetical protein
MYVLRKWRNEVLEKFHYARTLLAPGNAKFFSRSHDWVIRVYGAVGNVIETHEHTGQFKEWRRSLFSSSRTSQSKMKSLYLALPQIRFLIQKLCLVRRGRVAGRPAANRR